MFEISVKISQQGTLVEHNMFDEDEHFHQLKVENSQWGTDPSGLVHRTPQNTKKDTSEIRPSWM